MRLHRFALTIGLALSLGAAQAEEAQVGQDLTAVQVVQLTQSALIVLGYDPGPVDGVMGGQTRAALDMLAERSPLDIGWDGTAITPEQAIDLNQAAHPALEQAFGHTVDGGYVAAGVFPMSDTEALRAGTLPPFEPVPQCDRVRGSVARIDGLLVYEPGRPVAVVTVESPTMAPLPRTGAWHPEAEPWMLEIFSPNVVSFQQEGDHYVHVRCQ